MKKKKAANDQKVKSIKFNSKYLHYKSSKDYKKEFWSVVYEWKLFNDHSKARQVI